MGARQEIKKIIFIFRAKCLTIFKKLYSFYDETFRKNLQNLVKQRIMPHFLTETHPNYYEFTTNG